MIVLLNASAGGGTKDEVATQLASYLQKLGVSPRVELARNGEHLCQLARDAVTGPEEMIVAGGGDGTISSVASTVAGTGKVLGVLPLGTLNHFAKDLGVPLALEAAAATLVHGEVKEVDLGKVNDQVFINNSSIGLYPEIVRRRDKEQQLFNRSKWPAMVKAFFAALREYRFLRVQVRTSEGQFVRTTPFVFVGNNPYDLDSFGIGGRPKLSTGDAVLLAGARNAAARYTAARRARALWKIKRRARFRSALRIGVRGRSALAQSAGRLGWRDSRDARAAALPVVEKRIASDGAGERDSRLTMRVIVHLSDLHFGRIDHPLLEPLLTVIKATEPHLVAVSGDLTQRARSEQFDEAKAFLDRIPFPRLVVPGNHDISLHNLFERFVRPLRKYRELITPDLTPFHFDGKSRSWASTPRARSPRSMGGLTRFKCKPWRAALHRSAARSRRSS
jgi:diacylglycerol kinase family enzyme